jgi:hypothetical protein
MGAPESDPSDDSYEGCEDDDYDMGSTISESLSELELETSEEEHYYERFDC